MTKDVLVSISGAHVADGEPDSISVIMAGSYYFKNGKHYVIYDEMVDGVEGAVRNTLKISRDSVDIIKAGGVRSHMMFEKEKTNMSCYATPYGQMMVGVNTSGIEIRESENRLFVQIDYTLEINYESTSRCRIAVDIQSRQTADFHLGS